jgi:hypothetical protein
LPRLAKRWITFNIRRGSFPKAEVAHTECQQRNGIRIPLSFCIYPNTLCTCYLIREREGKARRRYFLVLILEGGRSQWPRGLRRRSLGCWGRGFMDVCLLCLYVVLSCAGRGLYDGLITRPEEPYRVSICVWSRNPEREAKGPAWTISTCEWMNEPLDLIYTWVHLSKKGSMVNRLNNLSGLHSSNTKPGWKISHP